jgi:hypothetical protein
MQKVWEAKPMKNECEFKGAIEDAEWRLKAEENKHRNQRLADRLQSFKVDFSEYKGRRKEIEQIKLAIKIEELLK